MDFRDFVEDLSKYEGASVFNPWGQSDAAHDIGAAAPEIRRENLTAYLAPRQQARWIFLAEALGYQGGHFSGVALTCERMFLGYHEIGPDQIFHNYQPRRTSKTCLGGLVGQKGFNEPTDTVVWGALLEHGIDPFQVVLWNIFPFHPYKDGDLLTNRTPNPQELSVGFAYLQKLRSILPEAGIVAIGRKAGETLAAGGLDCPVLRHPANGGANLFRQQLRDLLL